MLIPQTRTTLPIESEDILATQHAHIFKPHAVVLFPKNSAVKGTNELCVDYSACAEYQSPYPVAIEDDGFLGCTPSVDKDKNQKPEKVKTEMCNHWLESGVCARRNCWFAHGKEELRSVERHPQYKTKDCKWFVKTGTCHFGSRCDWRHPTDVCVAPSSARPNGERRPCLLERVGRASLSEPSLDLVTNFETSPTAALDMYFPPFLSEEKVDSMPSTLTSPTKVQCLFKTQEEAEESLTVYTGSPASLSTSSSVVTTNSVPLDWHSKVTESQKLWLSECLSTNKATSTVSPVVQTSQVEAKGLHSFVDAEIFHHNVAVMDLKHTMKLSQKGLGCSSRACLPFS